MTEFLRYQRVIALLILGMGLGGAGALYAGLPHQPQWALGLLLGTAVGFVKFRINVITLLRIADNTEDNPEGKMLGANFRGWLLTVAACVLAVVFSSVFNVWMAFAGTVLPNLVLTADGLLRPAQAAPTNAAAGAEETADA